MRTAPSGERLPHQPSGEHEAAQSFVPFEIAEVLGEDIAHDFIVTRGYIERLETLAKHEDPFKKPPEEDCIALDFVSPEYARRIQNYDEHRVTRSDLTGLGGRKLAKFNKQVLRDSDTFTERVRASMLSSRDALSLLGLSVDQLGQLCDEDPTYFREHQIVTLFMSMESIARHTPTKRTGNTLINFYRAAIDTYAQQASIIGNRVPRKFLGITKDLEGKKNHTKARVIPSIENLRQYGSESHEKTILIVMQQQAYAIDMYVNLIQLGKDHLLALSQGDEVERLGHDRIVAAEKFLIEQVDVVTAIIKGIDPGALGHHFIQDIVKELRKRTITKGLAVERANAVQPLPPKITQRLNEAKAILRGGQRLKPPKGSSSTDPQKHAAGLRQLRDTDGQRLLEPVESGILIAIATGKLDNFVETLRHADFHFAQEDHLLSPGQKGILEELRAVDISTFDKVNSLLEDPTTRIQMTQVFGFETVQSIQNTLKKLLENPGDLTKDYYQTY